MKTLVRAAAILFSLTLGASAAAAEGLTIGEAVKSDDRGAVATLLAQKADPNQRLSDSSTVLDWAVVHQNLEITRLLLAGGADPNLLDQDGMSPLMFACEYDDPAIVAALLDAKADARAARPDGISVLSLCAKTTTAANVERMIAGGAAVDVADSNGQTPLMWAAASGDLDKIALLLKHGAKVNAASAKGFTPLFFAIKSPSDAAPEALLAAGAELNHVAVDGTTPIMLAVYQKHWGVAAMLAQKGAELDHWDENGNQPLHAAAIYNQPELIKVLLAKGADVNALNKKPTLNWQNEPNAGPGPPPPFYAMPAIMVAANFGSADAMKAIMAGGAKTDFRAEDGTTLLLAASAGGSVAALDYAIQLVPDMSVANATGQTPVHLVLNNRRATVAGHLSPETPQMIALLVEKGAPIDVKNKRGQTPVEVAHRAEPEILAAFDAAVAARTKRQSEMASAAKPKSRLK
jgi:uncharacterized protein